MSDRVYNILMVEDNLNHHKILLRFIKKSGKNIVVDHVESAHEFFNVFLAKNYDLLMLDYNLAQYTGLSILQKLTEMQVTTPIIMVTQQKDPEIATNAMKLGAVDFIIKSKENFKYLPEKIIAYIHDYENEVANNEVFKLKRKGLMRSNEIKDFVRALVESKETKITPRSETSYFYEANLEGLDMDNATMEKVLHLLTVNRVLSKKPMAVRITCPRCDGDDVVTRPVCPNCGGKVFVKNEGGEIEEPLRCLSGCGQTFKDVQPAYVCNSCFKEFLQEESKYRHIYNFEVNVPMLEEMRQSMVNTDEMKMWEEKNKQYSENIEQTKQMQEEIRTQLRALIEHKIKKS